MTTDTRFEAARLAASTAWFDRHGREGVRRYTESRTVAAQGHTTVGARSGVPARRYARRATAALRAPKRAGGWWP